MFQRLQSVKNVTNKASSDSSKEMMALLKTFRIPIKHSECNAESKYGDVKRFEKMASQTAEIVNLFDKLSIDAGEKFHYHTK